MGRMNRLAACRVTLSALLTTLGLSGVLSATVPGQAGAQIASSVPARASSGCSLAQAATPGTADLLLAAGGDQGAYVREIPPTYSGHRPMPVVIDLHGYEETATLQVSLTQLGTYGDSHGFITITPQVADKVPMWETGLKSNDVAFIRGLLRTVDTTLCVDRNRVYVTGYSNGAFLTSTIACVLAGQVAAIAPVSGLENPSGCHPSRHIPVVTFHGTADQFVSYTGGLGPAALKLPAADGSSKSLGQELGKGAPQTKGPSIPAITAAWAARNKCAPKAHDTTIASDVTLIAYSCPKQADVELYRITGGGHAWPGSLFSKGIASVVGRTTFSISADQIIWRFFEAHPL